VARQSLNAVSLQRVGKTLPEFAREVAARDGTLVEMCRVLRCHPKVLRKQLAEQGFRVVPVPHVQIGSDDAPKKGRSPRSESREQFLCQI
jgi:putative component of membrane protein insertase Oxa1/YidC/SpoIIIJ protein YidD